MEKKLVIKNHVIGQGRPLVCIPVMEKTKEGIIQNIIKLVGMNVTMIEWRVDAFEEAVNPEAIRQVLASVSKIVKNTILVYTFRSKKQGGLLELSTEQIYEIHRIGAESKVADLIDVEFFESPNIIKEIKSLQKMGAHVIASHHDFSDTPTTQVMQMLLEQMNQSGVDILKLAVMPRQKMDVIRLLEVSAEFSENYPNRPLITMSMGPMGCISRVAGETFGSCVTFGAFEQASAPGQLPMQQLDQILDSLHESIALWDAK